MPEINLMDKIAPSFDNVLYDVLEHKYTHYWLNGGRGSTKSSFASLLVPLIIANNVGVNALILRKVGATLRDSVYNQILWAIDELSLSDYFKSTFSPLEITYKPTGQKIYFRGADDPIKIKSIKPQRGYIGVVLFEELDQFRGIEEVRNILQSANRGGEKYWNLYCYNPPKSKDNWVNVEVMTDDVDRLVSHSTYLDVPVEWLGDQFFKEAEKLKERNLQAYEHEYLGIATGTGGCIFENVIERRITDEEIQGFDKIHVGMDFGYAVDPLSYGLMHYDKHHEKLYIFDEIYQPKLSNKKAVELIKNKGYSNLWITADSAEPKSIADMCNMGLKVMGAKKGPDSIEHGVKWLQSLDEIIIDKTRTPNAYREFSLYEYDVDKWGNYISKYPDKDNHFIDCVRYAMEAEMRSKSVRWG